MMEVLKEIIDKINAKSELISDGEHDEYMIYTEDVKEIIKESIKALELEIEKGNQAIIENCQLRREIERLKLLIETAFSQAHPAGFMRFNYIKSWERFKEENKII